MTHTPPAIAFARTVHVDGATTIDAELRAPIAFAAGDVLRLVAVGGQVVSHVVHVVAHHTPAAAAAIEPLGGCACPSARPLQGSAMAPGPAFPSTGNNDGDDL